MRQAYAYLAHTIQLLIKRNISGILLLDKPYGISSNKAVQIIKRIFSAAKCGHTGTLDPMATGLLPLCLGEATKFSSILLGADKAYEATLKLGFLSTTGDAEGDIVQVKTTTIPPGLLQCERVLSRFIGRIRQIPPMYSALKHNGKPLYAYARKGETIERPPREVHIYDITIKSLKENELCLCIHCSTGTYIRTLAEDIGKALGCGGAYLTQLRRTAIDYFDLTQTYTLTALEEMTAIDRDKYLLPTDHLLKKFPAVILDELAASHIMQGRTVANQTLNTGDKPTNNLVRLYDSQEQFLGLGEITSDRKIVSKRLLANSQ